MNIPGLKDWRTSLPGIITAIAGFVMHKPHLFPKDQWWGVWIVEISDYLFVAGIAGLGINAASNAKVKEKTEERIQSVIAANQLDDPGKPQQ